MPKIKNNQVKHSQILTCSTDRLPQYVGMSKKGKYEAKNDYAKPSFIELPESPGDIQAFVEKIAGENDAMRDRIMDLEMCLAWYASPENWRRFYVQSDKGDRARAILNAGRELF